MAGRRQSPVDRRRRELAQNLLVDPSHIAAAITWIGADAQDLLVEVGPGRGALTLPLARCGARIVAVEADRGMALSLRDRVQAMGAGDRVRVVHCDIRRFRWPREPYRVVGNLPFNRTTQILERLLDDPAKGPWRADLLVQREVAEKRASTPPSTLRSAAWAPWWTVQAGPVVPRTAFRPSPAVEGRWITVRRREPAILPEWLAPTFRDVLRPGWARQAGS